MRLWVCQMHGYGKWPPRPLQPLRCSTQGHRTLCSGCAPVTDRIPTDKYWGKSESTEPEFRYPPKTTEAKFWLMLHPGHRTPILMIIEWFFFTSLWLMIPTIISHDSVRVRTAKSMDMMNCLLDPFNHFDATGQVTVLRVQVARRGRTEFQPIQQFGTGVDGYLNICRG